MKYKVIYIMGVSGSGKTTIGQQLSERTGYPFYDADDFHTKNNKASMKVGKPLTDADRWPWLQNIQQFVIRKIKTGNIIMACSALKEAYRDRLSQSIEENCTWIFLQGDYETILKRVKERTDHYMPSTLLQSQFDTLEVPVKTLMIDIKLAPETILDTILSKIKTGN